MIKRIQLRGISRSPSDRMNSEGGCAESLNFQILETESAPAVAPAPVDILPSGFSGDVIFIHKTKTYTNYITYQNGSLGCIINKVHTIFLQNVTSSVKVTALGNMLVCVDEGSAFYVLYLNGKYSPLGGSIPFPELRMGMTLLDEDDAQEHETITFAHALVMDGRDILPGNIDNEIIRGFWTDSDETVLSSNPYFEYYDYLKQLSGRMKERADLVTKYYKKYRRPVFVKYSLVLYDGTEIDSDPVLLVPSLDAASVYGIATTYTTASGTPNLTSDYYNKIDVYVRNLFDITINKNNAADSDLENLLENWGEIVKGVRVYLSDDVVSEYFDTFTGMKSTNFSIHQSTHTSGQGSFYKNQCRVNIEKTDIDRDVLLSKASFFCVNEYSIEELLNGPYSRTIDWYSNDDRALRKDLDAADVQGKHNYVPGLCREYNGRLLSANMDVKLYHGSLFQLSHIGDESRTLRNLVSVYYMLRDGVGSNYTANSTINLNKYDAALSYLFYPDSRCYKAYIEMSDEWYEVTMDAHPSMNAAVFLDMDTPVLADLLAGVKSGEPNGKVKYLGTEEPQLFSNVIHSGNRLYQSEYGNIYQYSGFVTLSGNVIGISVNTQALSAGQAGEYPIIAFTDNGIFGVNCDEAGEMQGVSPLPRDVAVKDRIWQIDNATVFKTASSVCLISGSQVQDLSSDMKGAHYSLESAVSQVMNNHGYGSLVSQVSDSSLTFNAFLDGAQMAYDYNGQRLLFFRSDRSYAYVLMMRSNTWHKISLPASHTFSNVLNSYPQAYAVLKTSGHTKVYDFSSVLNNADMYKDSASSTRGVIISRPFDLEEPDVLKSISHLKVRGQYERTYKDTQSVTMTGSSIHVDDPGDMTEDNLAEIITSLPVMVESYSSLEDVLSGDEDLHVKDSSASTREQIEELFSEYGGEVTISNWSYTGSVLVDKPRVICLLLGSQDGRKFYRLESLRGKAWKMFRLVVMANLRPTERISWVDVEYESRFTNKIR